MVPEGAQKKGYLASILNMCHECDVMLSRWVCYFCNKGILKMVAYKKHVFCFAMLAWSCNIPFQPRDIFMQTDLVPSESRKKACLSRKSIPMRMVAMRPRAEILLEMIQFEYIRTNDWMMSTQNRKTSSPPPPRGARAMTRCIANAAREGI